LVEQLQQPQKVNTPRHHALVHDETSDLSVAILRIAEFGITRGEIPMLASNEAHVAFLAKVSKEVRSGVGHRKVAPAVIER